MKQAVLKIYYTDKFNKLHVEPQGKFFYMSGKPVFLADMTDAKWWRNFGGYSIAKQILDAFSKVKVRPQIIYRVKEKHTIYIANPTLFKKRGVLVAFGGHEQYVLPIQNWKAVDTGIESEPKDLPVIALSDWIKTSQTDSIATPQTAQTQYRFEGNTAIPITEPTYLQEKIFT